MAKKKDENKANPKTAVNGCENPKEPVNADVKEPTGTDEKTDESGIPETVTLTRDEFLQVKAKLDALEKEKAENIAFTQRLQADFDNYRKRNAAISADSLDEGSRNVIKALLPVIDDLERAIAAAPADSGESDASWINGVKLVQGKFTGILAKFGLEEVPADGQFDPELHNAVLQEEAEDAQSGDITGVLQKGYRVKNRIIRHTMVKVAK